MGGYGSYIVGAAIITLLSSDAIAQSPMLADFRIWQLVFFAVGIPGLLLSVIFFFTTREPPRSIAKASGSTPSIKEVAAYVGKRYRLYLGLFLGAGGVNVNRLAGVVLLFVGLMLDTVDGVVARKTQQTSLFGSVLDIAADRTYELVLWVSFASLQLIPVAIPLIVIARTTITDAFRGIGVSQSAAPFSQHRTALGKFLVGSTVMRVGYSVSKIAAFVLLATAQALGGFEAGSGRAVLGARLLEAGQAVAWVAVGFCVLRGLPVVIHGFKEHWGVTVRH